MNAFVRHILFIGSLAILAAAALLLAGRPADAAPQTLINL